MPELSTNLAASLKRDVDQLQADVDELATSTVATVLSYDDLSRTGSARTSDGRTLSFKNWTGETLVLQSSILLLTKDLVNYAVGTEKTISGWASVQTVVYRPVAETVVPLLREDAGRLMITQGTGAEIQVPITHDLALLPGQSIDFIRGNTAEVRFLAAGTPSQIVTLNSTPGLRLQSRWSAASLVCVSGNNYILIGDLKP